MTLHVEESGSLSAPTIVFLHGGGTGGWMWTQQVEDLRDFHLLVVDLPGHAKSNAVRWQSLADTADQIGAIIRERAHGGRAHLVGLSLGGYTALQTALQHNPLVESLLVSGVTAEPLNFSLAMKNQMRVMGFLMRYRWFARVQGRMMQLPPDAVELYADSVMAMSRDTYDAVLREVMGYRLPDGLSQMQTPTLVVAGGAEMPSIIDSVRAIPAAMPCARGFLAPDLHHGWNGEDPALFSAMVRAWITGAPLPETLQPQS